MKGRGGIDLGGTKIQAVVIDGRNQVRGQSRRSTPQEGGPGDVAAAIAAAMRDAAGDAGTTPEELAGIGVGSPGLVDDDAGTVTSARNLPGWEESYELARALADTLGAPVRLGNDVQVATEAEVKLGAGRGLDSVLGVFWGTGVGGGLVLAGRPWLGRGEAGEIGHMVVKRGGARCTCGRRGCMEAYAGRMAMELKARRAHERGKTTVLFELMREHDRPKLTSGIWSRAVEHGDELAIRLINRAIKALGAGIASAVNLVDPEAVIIGGGMGVRFGETGVERIREAMQPHLFADDHPPDVRLVALGDLGGAIGAALLG
jgi:glucokinase